MLHTYSKHCKHFHLDTKILLQATKTLQNFDDGSTIPPSSDKVESGKSSMRNNPNFKNSGVQSNSKVSGNAAGTSRTTKRNKSGSNGKSNENLNTSSSGRGFNQSVKYNPINLSGTLVSKKLNDRYLLVNPMRYSNQDSIDLRFTVKPIREILDAQALTWAKRIDSSFELDLYRIFGRERNPGDYILRLKEIYIYSYYKSLLLGMNEYRIDQTSDSDHVLIGHAILYQMLYKRSYSLEVNGLYVNYFLEFSTENSDFVLNEAKQYTFIANSILEAGNRFNIMNSQIERHIEGLRYSIMENDCDVIFIRLSNLTQLLSYTSGSSLPLANSFWSADQKKWFYAYNDFSQINGNTLLYGKANFITLRCIDSNTLRDFDLVNFNRSQTILIKYEVSCIASSKYSDIKVMDEDNSNPKN